MELRGLGDRWEAETRRRFNRQAESFLPPTDRQSRAVVELTASLREVADRADLGGLAEAERQARELGLRVDTLSADTGRYLVLRECQPRGWGTAVFRCGSDSGLVVQVPHPLSDYRTPELGLRMFERSGAEVYLLAGANRYNRSEPSPDQPHRRLSDAAHSSRTFFHAAHQGVVEPGDTVLQLHGFDDRPGDPAVVLSDGLDDGRDPPAVADLLGSLTEHGIPGRISDFRSPLDRRLGARGNLQLQDMERRGLLEDSTFVHVEVNEPLRKQADDTLVSAVADWAHSLLGSSMSADRR
ncbi:MAG: hypothetical protein AB1758_16720 [Candidatus Eremiobacterota bacterium]